MKLFRIRLSGTFCLCLVILILCSSCTDDEGVSTTEFTATVSGRVTDAVSGEELASVNVSLLRGSTSIQSTTTTSDGSYQLSPLVKGEESFRIIAVLENYEDAVFSEVVLNSGNQQHEQDIPLQPKSSIIGVVRNANSDQPLENVTVLLSNQSQSKSTTGLGEFEFLGLDAGEYRLSFSRNRFKTQEQTITVNAGQEVPMIVGLEPIAPVLEVDVLSRDFGVEETTLTLELRNTGGDTVKWEIAESIPWLFVNPSSGNITDESAILNLSVNRNGFEPGTYSQAFSINSNAGKKDIQVSMTKSGALIKVSPSAISFGTDQSEVSLQLSRVGQGTLNYEIQSDVDWLSIDPISGSISNELDFIKVKAERSVLGIGNHRGRIAINSDNGSQSVNVSLVVSDPNAPQLSVEQSVINFGSDAVNRVVTLINSGEGTVTWDVAKAASWLTLEKGSGELMEGESENILVTVDRIGLSPDNYNDVLRFTSNGGNINIPVEMTIANRPVLSISTDQLTFSRGTDALSFNISNVGNGGLEWQLSDNQDWISVNPSSGSNNATVNVSVSRDGLEFGNYGGQIEITSDGGESSVTVEMLHFPPNDAPTADFSITPQSAAVNDVVILDASMSSDDNDPLEELEVRWKLDVVQGFTNWSVQKSISTTYNQLGVKDIILEVRDGNRAVGSVTKQINIIQNESPTAFFAVNPPSGERNNTLFTFDASGSSDDIDDISELSVRWQFEGGEDFTEWSRNKVTTHRYATEGIKTTILEVMDRRGLTDQFQLTIEVIDNGDRDDDGIPDRVDADDDNDGLIDIYTINDLHNIRNDLSAQGLDLQGLPVSGAIGYELMNDLDFDNDEHYSDLSLKPQVTTGAGWLPIGLAVNQNFATTLEGNGFVINNLLIDRTSSYTALIAYTSILSSIKNLKVKVKSLSGNDFTAGLIGNNRGNVTNCSVSGRIVENGGSAGLLVGRNEKGSITNCYSEGNITSPGDNIGGLIGVIGRNSSDRTFIDNCYSTASVKGDRRVGGLIGYMLAGYTFLNYSYATGDVKSTNSEAGGLVGNFWGEIKSCYATGNVTSSSYYVGGLVGEMRSGPIITSYSTGKVFGSSSYGGLIGRNSGSVSSSNYWDTQTSGLTSSAGSATGLSTQELQSQTTNAGIYITWDTNVWDFGTATQYPALKNMPNGLEVQR